MIEAGNLSTLSISNFAVVNRKQGDILFTFNSMFSTYFR